jgi:hypothetical protein
LDSSRKVIDNKVIDGYGAGVGGQRAPRPAGGTFSHPVVAKKMEEVASLGFSDRTREPTAAR